MSRSRLTHLYCALQTVGHLPVVHVGRGVVGLVVVVVVMVVVVVVLLPCLTMPVTQLTTEAESRGPE